MEENLMQEVAENAMCNIHEYLEKNGIPHFAQVHEEDPVYVKRLFIPADQIFFVLSYCSNMNYVLRIEPIFFAMFGDGDTPNKRFYEIFSF